MPLHTSVHQDDVAVRCSEVGFFDVGERLPRAHLQDSGMKRDLNQNEPGHAQEDKAAFVMFRYEETLQLCRSIIS